MSDEKHGLSDAVIGFWLAISAGSGAIWYFFSFGHFCMYWAAILWIVTIVSAWADIRKKRTAVSPAPETTTDAGSD